ncbi:unnamed protein product, partial [Effrenium voratum]
DASEHAPGGNAGGCSGGGASRPPPDAAADGLCRHRESHQAGGDGGGLRQRSEVLRAGGFWTSSRDWAKRAK